MEVFVKKIELTIYGEPVAKARHRTTRSGVTYTPKKTKNYEAVIKRSFKEEYPNFEPCSGEVSLRIDAYFQIPKSATILEKVAMKNGWKRPTKKPDIDNVIKSIADGLNGLAYLDDKQIVSIVAHKCYGEPRVELEIWEKIDG